jgi:hypothetical protein
MMRCLSVRPSTSPRLAIASSDAISRSLIDLKTSPRTSSPTSAEEAWLSVLESRFLSSSERPYVVPILSSNSLKERSLLYLECNISNCSYINLIILS